jgi:putative endonuclease
MPESPRPPVGASSKPEPTESQTVPAPAASAVAEHWVYLLCCADGTYYTGYTTDVERRIAEHNAGDGAKYTAGRTPVELVHAEGHPTRSAALTREHEIKAMNREVKERLARPADGDLLDEQ